MKIRSITFILSLILFLTFTSCTSTVRFRVMKPAVIDVPKDIQNLSTANRYKPDKPANQFLNVLEGLFSGEGIGTDRRGAEACLEAFSVILNESPRYKFSRLSVDLKGTGTANFPAPLEVSEVKRLCQMSNADALVTIEAFDSDSKMDYSTSIARETRNGQSVDVTKFKVNAGVRVTVGWRMYRASDGAIIDQYTMVETVNFSREGNSKDEANRRLPNKDAMTREIGKVVGNLYATRISPAWFFVNRDYFSKAKGAPEMKIAKKSARVNDWEGAAKIWKQLSNNPNPKISRRAMYNMAVASEYLGELNSAIDWSEKSYKLGLNKALNYNGILRQRLFDQQRLDNQLSKPEN